MNGELGDLIINFAPTGMVPTRRHSPYVPLSPGEIIESVLAADSIGISIAHLHARDASGSPTLSTEMYEEIILGIRKYAPELVLCVSLSGRLTPSFEHRSAPLDLSESAKPDMSSLTLSSLNFPNAASVNQPDVVLRLAEKMKTSGIMPELEVFDSGMLQVAKRLIANGTVRLPAYINLFFGNPASAQLDFLDIANMTSRLPEGCYCAFGGIGRYQLPANALAIATGAGVRLGLEDNLRIRKGELATNESLLRRAHQLAEIHGRNIMKPAKFRTLLQLKKGNGEYGIL